jgi:hypothetical protein
LAIQTHDLRLQTGGPVICNQAAAAAVTSSEIAMMPDFARQAEDMLKAAQEARIPDQVKVVVEQGVQQARHVVSQVTDLAAQNAKTTEGMMVAYQAGAKTIGDKLMENTKVNAEAAFNAATAMVQAKSLPEAAQMQAEFMKAQMTLAASQFQELFQLSGRVAQTAFQHVGAATQSSFAAAPAFAAAVAPKAKKTATR